MASSTCCSRCKAITGSSQGLIQLYSDAGYRHLAWHEMEHSANSGCGLCKAVIERAEMRSPELVILQQRTSGQNFGFDFRVRPIWSTSDEEFKDQDQSSPFGHRRLSKLAFNLPTETSLIEATFDVETASGDPAATSVAKATEHKAFNDEVSFNLRKSVIDCLTEHNIDDCPGKRTGQLPRRVLNVGLPVDERVNEEMIVPLYESHEGDKAIYTTLSYCWGDPKHQITTTKANLNSHKQGILSIEKLPQTIADAITITRHLGVQYLWVDSLCIIQDDEVDKMEQIEAMHEIYKNSFCTIAASSAAGVSEGFLKSSKPLKSVAQLPLLISDDIDAEHGTLYLRGDWNPVSVSDEPLYSRAWSFQETVLSPRVLDFNTYNSVHMCSHFEYPSLFTDNKAIDYDWPGQEIFKAIHRLESFKFFQALYFAHPRYAFRRGEFDRNQFGMWRDVVYEYSARRLSLHEDRLPALAGVAKRFSSYFGQYVAGMWKESIVYHLGWEHRNMRKWPYGKFEPEVTSIAQTTNDTNGSAAHGSLPSWSWISVPYGVSVAPLLKADLSIVECHAVVVDERSPYGQVRAGSLVLRGRVLELSELPFVVTTHPDGNRTAFEAERSIWLDHNKAIAQSVAKTRLLYLGSRSHWDGNYGVELHSPADARTFIVIQKLANTQHQVAYQRIGIFKLEESDSYIISGDLDRLLSLKQEEDVLIV